MRPDELIKTLGSEYSFRKFHPILPINLLARFPVVCFTEKQVDINESYIINNELINEYAIVLKTFEDKWEILYFFYGEPFFVDQIDIEDCIADLEHCKKNMIWQRSELFKVEHVLKGGDTYIKTTRTIPKNKSTSQLELDYEFFETAKLFRRLHNYFLILEVAQKFDFYRDEERSVDRYWNNVNYQFKLIRTGTRRLYLHDREIYNFINNNRKGSKENLIRYFGKGSFAEKVEIPKINEYDPVQMVYDGLRTIEDLNHCNEYNQIIRDMKLLNIFEKLSGVTNESCVLAYKIKKKYLKSTNKFFT